MADSVSVKTYLYRCFYFCPDFYKVYRRLQLVYKFYAKFQGLMAFFCCQAFLKKIQQYVSEDKPYFFGEAKKIVIQYYIPVGDSTLEMTISIVTRDIRIDNL